MGGAHPPFTLPRVPSAGQSGISYRNTLQAQSSTSPCERTIQRAAPGRGDHSGPWHGWVEKAREVATPGPEGSIFCTRPSLNGTRAPATASPTSLGFEFSAPHHPTHLSLLTPPVFPWCVMKSDGSSGASGKCRIFTVPFTGPYELPGSGLTASPSSRR